MSTADISMSYSSMSDLAKAVIDMQSDFETLRTNLDNLVNDLDGQWQGAAQVEFATAYSKLKPKLTTIHEALGKFADAVQLTAGDQSSTESGTAQAMSNLSF